MPEAVGRDLLNAPWLGLIIGNTRLHWGLFCNQTLLSTWHTPHLTPAIAEPLMQQQFHPAAWPSLSSPTVDAGMPSVVWEQMMAAEQRSLPLYCASVVPQQTSIWQEYDQFRGVELSDVPLGNLYSTLGIDRALNLVGAGDRYGWPSMVIDAGTALTFTAGTKAQLIGGAILPGVSTQCAALSQNTATLPPIAAAKSLPHRWSTATPEAIRSGVIYGTLAAIQDFVKVWQQDYPGGTVILTGGDSVQIYDWLSQTNPGWPVRLDPELAFWGLRGCRHHRLTTDHSA